jgi:hypothetical protein
MKLCGKLILIFVLLVVIGCDLSGDESGFLVFSESFDFTQGQHDWQVDFTDFPSGPDDSTFYELQHAYTSLPENLGINKKSIMVSGNNHSDDLFMFMKKKITDLAPNTDYAIVFEVTLASNAPKGAVGIGGAPGESVYLKAGGSALEPKKVIDGQYFVLNVDKGNQATAGENTVVLGNIAVPYDTEDYALITRDNGSVYNVPFVAKSNSKGELWLIVGTDSGFEGITTVYYTSVNVVFSVIN